MKLYSQRIAFMVSYQTLIPHGGIGQFTKSIVDMMTKEGVKVDLILDKEPADNEFVRSVKNAGANIIFPNEALSYSRHSAMFSHGDTFCYERMTNFRESLLLAFSQNLYDAIVCNTYETVQVAHSIGIGDLVQIIAYTHLESQIFEDTFKNPFTDETNEQMRNILNCRSLTVGTQSAFNKEQFTGASNVRILPIPMPEPSLLNRSTKPREGVLFIGRWEPGKNPKAFIKLIEETKLPARVMTSINSAKKFEEAFKEIGCENFDIRVGIIGQDKTDFITGCRVAFNPSKVESYGIAFMETLAQMPTVAIEGQRWLNNFPSQHFYPVSAQNAASTVTKLYEQFDNADTWYQTGALDFVKNHHTLASDYWMQCLDQFDPASSNINTANILQHETVKYGDFIKNLNRKVLSWQDDLRGVLSNRKKFKVVFTDTDTYLSKDQSFVPANEDNTESLFDWS